MDYDSWVNDGLVACWLMSVDGMHDVVIHDHEHVPDVYL